MEWNQEFVRAPQALALLPKTPEGLIDWGTPGEPQAVKAAQFDTGFTRHPALGFEGTGDSPFLCAADGKDCLQPRRPLPEDPLLAMKGMPPGHGTRTGTCLAGRSAAFQGLAPGLPLVPYRVTNHSIIFEDAADAIAKGLDRVIAEVAAGKQAPIVNISLGRPFGHATMGAAVDRAYEAGILTICAAGQLIDVVTYPAKHARTIAVAGIERTSRGAYKIYERYSSYARVDAWAPAEPVRRGDVASEDYGYGDGTSYACLHVTAAAAMWWRYRAAEIGRLYSQPWQRIEAFRYLLLKKDNPLSPDQDAALRFSQAEVRHLDEHSNRGRLVNCEKLLTEPLPDPALLEKRMDLAADDLA